MAKKKRKINPTQRNVDLMLPIYNRLVEGDIPPVAAAGIVGNMMAESTMNHNSVNASNHRGLLQNDTNIYNYHLKHYGNYNLDTQLQFVLDGWHGRLKDKSLQMRFNNYKNSVTNDVASNAENFEKYYEKSGGDLLAERRAYASQLIPFLPQAKQSNYIPSISFSDYIAERANNFMTNMQYIHPSLVEEPAPYKMINAQDEQTTYGAPTIDPETYNRIFGEENQQKEESQIPQISAFDVLTQMLNEAREKQTQQQKMPPKNPQADYSKWLQNFNFEEY